MSPVLMLLAVALVVAHPSGPDEDPRVIIRSGLRAVEGDSVTTLRARWEARLRRDSTDGAPRSASRRSPGSPTTIPPPSASTGHSSPPRDRTAYAFAQLGLAWGRDARDSSNDADSGFVRARAGARDVGDRTAEGEALLGLAFSRARAEGMRVALAILDTAARLDPRQRARPAGGTPPAACDDPRDARQTGSGGGSRQRHDRRAARRCSCAPRPTVFAGSRERCRCGGRWIPR